MSRTAVALASALLLFAACGGGTKVDYSQSGPPRASGSTADPNAVPANPNVANPAAPPNTDIPGKPPAAALPGVDVQLTEYEIRMPETLQAGQMSLNIANAGKEDHGFNIEGGGYATSLPEPLKRGDTRMLDVTLKPGTYSVWCPVDGHKGKGMQKTVTVR